MSLLDRTPDGIDVWLGSGDGAIVFGTEALEDFIAIAFWLWILFAFLVGWPILPGKFSQ